MAQVTGQVEAAEAAPLAELGPKIAGVFPERGSLREVTAQRFPPDGEWLGSCLKQQHHLGMFGADKAHAC